MRLENRAPAEGINASDEHPLREFAWLAGGALAALVATVVAVSLGAQWLAPKLPYRYEARLVRDLPAQPPPTDARGREALAELQALADRLAARMVLPEGMRVTVGLRDERVANAYATLGGHAVVFRGLLSRLDSEDALATVMAHEIAHLAHRHPAAALGRGVAIGIVLSVVSAESGRGAAGAVLGQAGTLAALSFNRDQEREADREALRVVAAEYGHVGGAVDLFDAFEAMQRARGDGAATRVEWLRTHPLSERRALAAREWAAARGVPVDGARRPLPPALAAMRAAGPARR